MADPLHHIQKRKRVHRNHTDTKKYEPYPHPNPLKRYVDQMVYGASIFVPAMTALQAGKIWFEKDAKGISLITWAGFSLANIVWLLYGILHKEKPIVCMYTLLFFCNISIVIGAFLYG
ncbi:MAG: hypothetical protein COV60_03070 [Candidatus Magasanikbacteria bacterium CG11_big_fil_rev_8_21_14_0_20_43_7]|uniref:MtN3 and saliva related transmembrane protein n=1 Tax=Candidatus Magasanikbacteria bacterium CG11_big_fil_rev_8_21_14_0_20_43_7 TaxID=1974654 RepID=A0A2H0N216_9BACT|nr:MAG: hypothetical protein COV60_03070 [Candidatus Magasanikbacteria bacterium CG11_big_fil_rev_8_21_14_0_20_43_7]